VRLSPCRHDDSALLGLRRGVRWRIEGETIGRGYGYGYGYGYG
jgi:hypothetical protein